MTAYVLLRFPTEPPSFVVLPDHPMPPVLVERFVAFRQRTGHPTPALFAPGELAVVGATIAAWLLGLNPGTPSCSAGLFEGDVPHEWRAIRLGEGDLRDLMRAREELAPVLQLALDDR